MKTKILCLLTVLISTWCSNVVFAQFYDDEDEILFYERTLYNGKPLEDTDYTNVFNFDGEKAAIFDYKSAWGIKNVLKRNKNYFEEQVFNVKYDVKYRPDLSSSSWVVYSRYEVGYAGWSTWTSYWYFSKDRKTMIYKESSSNNEWTYKLKEKKYYIEEGRSRSNLDNEIIYE